MPSFFSLHNTTTVFPSYSDTLRTREKCHSKQMSFKSHHFWYMKGHLGPVKTVTVSGGVTVSGEICSETLRFFCFSTPGPVFLWSGQNGKCQKSRRMGQLAKSVMNSTVKPLVKPTDWPCLACDDRGSNIFATSKLRTRSHPFFTQGDQDRRTAARPKKDS